MRHLRNRLGGIQKLCLPLVPRPLIHRKPQRTRPTKAVQRTTPAQSQVVLSVALPHSWSSPHYFSLSTRRRGRHDRRTQSAWTPLLRNSGMLWRSKTRISSNVCMTPPTLLLSLLQFPLTEKALNLHKLMLPLHILGSTPGVQRFE